MVHAVGIVFNRYSNTLESFCWIIAKLEINTIPPKVDGWIFCLDLTQSVV